MTEQEERDRPGLNGASCSSKDLQRAPARPASQAPDSLGFILTCFIRFASAKNSRRFLIARQCTAVQLDNSLLLGPLLFLVVAVFCSLTVSNYYVISGPGASRGASASPPAREPASQPPPPPLWAPFHFAPLF